MNKKLKIKKSAGIDRLPGELQDELQDAIQVMKDMCEASRAWAPMRGMLERPVANLFDMATIARLRDGTLTQADVKHPYSAEGLGVYVHVT